MTSLLTQPVVFPFSLTFRHGSFLFVCLGLRTSKEHYFRPILRPDLFAAFLLFFSLAVGGPQPCLKCCKQQLLLLKALSMVHSFGLIRVLGIWVAFPPPGRRRGFPIDFSFRRQRTNNLAIALSARRFGTLTLRRILTLRTRMQLTFGSF